MPDLKLGGIELRDLRSSVLVVFFGMTLAVGISLIVLWLTRSDEPDVDITATADLLSLAGDPIGRVQFTQGESSLLIEAEASGLEPGGHAFIIHSVGACEADFSSAGGHFDPETEERGFVHSNWNRRDSPQGGHSGDLPNVYAASDGTVRADFFASGVTLESGHSHSLLDADGSAIIIHEKPISYATEDEDTGARVACGVIRRN